MSEIASLNNIEVTYRTRGYSTSFREWFSKGGRLIEKRTEVQALREISFQLTQGERVGIIGHNGSGKSTLCRVLSGALLPNAGSIRRTSMPRCVSDGCYPLDLELTGKENALFLGNLHYPYENTKALAQEILELCDLKQAENLPVKAYSRGMMARLSLAVACLRPAKWLIIDEALGGVDSYTLPRFLNRFELSLSQSGGAIMVSHDTSQLEKFCNRLLVLEHGKIIFDGDIVSGLKFYEQSVLSAS